MLKSLNVDLRNVRKQVEKLIRSAPDAVTMGKLPQTPRAKKVIEYAIAEARELNHNYVGTEHLLLGLIRDHDGVAGQVLGELGLTSEIVRAEIANLLGETTDDKGESDLPFRLPGKMTVIPIAIRPGWARLGDETERPISAAMPLELANEIVKRYNAFQEPA